MGGDNGPHTKTFSYFYPESLLRFSVRFASSLIHKTFVTRADTGWIQTKFLPHCLVFEGGHDA